MASRWRRWIRNAGLWGVVRGLFVFAVLVAAALLAPFHDSRYWTLFPALVLGVTAPRWALELFIDHLQATLKIHRAVGIVIVLTIGFFGNAIGQASPYYVAAGAAVVSCYLGVHFWVLSDERIVSC